MESGENGGKEGEEKEGERGGWEIWSGKDLASEETIDVHG